MCALVVGDEKETAFSIRNALEAERLAKAVCRTQGLHHFLKGIHGGGGVASDHLSANAAAHQPALPRHNPAGAAISS